MRVEAPERFAFREARSGDEPAIRAVVRSVLNEFGFDVEPDGLDRDVDDIESSYSQRGGTFRVLTSSQGEIVGCGGLYPLEGRDVELRKMYFLAVARGRGLGRALLHELIEFGRRAGYNRIFLETASKLTVAGHLYRSVGFVETTSDHLAGRADQALVLNLRSS
jgi:putative acetyltransferase